LLIFINERNEHERTAINVLETFTFSQAFVTISADVDDTVNNLTERENRYENVQKQNVDDYLSDSTELDCSNSSVTTRLV